MQASEAPGRQCSSAASSDRPRCFAQTCHGQSVRPSTCQKLRYTSPQPRGLESAELGRWRRLAGQGLVPLNGSSCCPPRGQQSPLPLHVICHLQPGRPWWLLHLCLSLSPELKSWCCCIARQKLQPGTPAACVQDLQVTANHAPPAARHSVQLLPVSLRLFSLSATSSPVMCAAALLADHSFVAS